MLYYGYFALFEAIWIGQTPGKRVARIRVIKETGRPINAVESIARNMLRLVDQLPVLYAVGIVTVLLNRKSKRLGDFVAGTIVVHERSLQDIKPLWQAPSGAATFQYGSHSLSPEEFALIEAFLNRRDSLAPDVRYRMAEQIVIRIRTADCFACGRYLDRRDGCWRPSRRSGGLLLDISERQRDEGRFA